MDASHGGELEGDFKSASQTCDTVRFAATVVGAGPLYFTDSSDEVLCDVREGATIMVTGTPQPLGGRILVPVTINGFIDVAHLAQTDNFRSSDLIPQQVSVLNLHGDRVATLMPPATSSVRIAKKKR